MLAADAGLGDDGGAIVAEVDDANSERVAYVRGLNYRQFKTLSAEEIVYLTPEQISTIPSAGWLRTIKARGAFTLDQIQALRVDKTGVKDLSKPQRGLITKDQVQILKYREFRYLNKDQVPSLTDDQINTIPSAGWLRTIGARGALTVDQIPALRVNKTGMKDLNETQRAAVTQGQVETIGYREFRYLNDKQVPWLTDAQLETIPTQVGCGRSAREAR